MINACTVLALLTGLLSDYKTTLPEWQKLQQVHEYQRKQCAIVEEKADEDAFQVKAKAKAEAKAEKEKSEKAEKEKAKPEPTPTPSQTPEAKK